MVRWPNVVFTDNIFTYHLVHYLLSQTSKLSDPLSVSTAVQIKKIFSTNVLLSGLQCQCF